MARFEGMTVLVTGATGGFGRCAAERFAGTARYTLEFDAPVAADDYLLDLGKVAESARVRINGRDLGTLFAAPFHLRTGPLRRTGNRLEIEVTNLSANRIRDLDRRGVQWKVFYDINFVGIDYKPFDASGWRFLRPCAGWRAQVLGDGRIATFDGAGWSYSFAYPGPPETLPKLGIGTTADAANPFALRADNALMTSRDVAEGGGDLRVKLNKATPARTASLVFQSNWSGRAELGLTGDDRFRIKVSADGSVWPMTMAMRQRGSGAPLDHHLRPLMT